MAAANNTDSVAYMFDDSSVVWVVFQQGSAVNSNIYEMARSRLGISLNNLKRPPDGKGNRISHQTVVTIVLGVSLASLVGRRPKSGSKWVRLMLNRFPHEGAT